MVPGDPLGLQFRESLGDLGRVRAFDPERVLDRAFVDPCRLRLESESRVLQQGAARRTGGGENDPGRRPGCAGISQSVCLVHHTSTAHYASTAICCEKWFMMVAAVSSMERRVTSITGQSCSLHSRRASATSSRTLLRSV